MPTLTSLPHDVLHTLCAYPPPSALAALIQTHSTLYTAGVPLLLRHVVLQAPAQAASLGLLLGRKPELGRAVQSLCVGSHVEDGSGAIKGVLEKTAKARVLELPASDASLKQYIPAIAGYTALDTLRLSLPPSFPYRPAASGVYTLLSSLRAPLKRLALDHIPDLHLAALLPFTRSLEELSVTGGRLTTESLPRSVCWKSVQTLVLAQCVFDGEQVARLFPNVQAVEVRADEVAYGGVSASPVPAAEDDPMDDEGTPWTALKTLRVDVPGLRLLPFSTRTETLNLRPTVLGAQADPALAVLAVEAVRASQVKVVVGREAKEDVWVRLGEAGREGLEGLEVEVIWDMGWGAEAGDYITSLTGALSALPLRSFSVVLRPWVPPSPKGAGHPVDFAPPPAAQAAQFSLYPRNTYERLCAHACKTMPKLERMRVGWAEAGWSDEWVDVRAD